MGYCIVFCRVLRGTRTYFRVLRVLQSTVRYCKILQGAAGYLGCLGVQGRSTKGTGGTKGTVWYCKFWGNFMVSTPLCPPVPRRTLKKYI